MKAVLFERFGAPEVLRVAEVKTPEPAAGEVLVRVRAAGVNLADTLMRQDRYAITPGLPCIPGQEVAGVVEKLGPQVAGLRVGDRVAAPLFAGGAFTGGYAQFVTIPAQLAVPLPRELPFETAAALLVQGLTALHLARLARPGSTAMVSAAAGGVGSLLVQLLKRAGTGAVIAAAGSATKLELAASLGADHGIDYTHPQWVQDLRQRGTAPDIIFESVGGAVTRSCLDVLAPQGELVVYGALNIQDFQLGVPELLGLIFKNQSVTGFAVAPLLTPENLHAGLGELFALALAGELKVVAGGTYPMEKAAAAHEALESRKTVGKLVLTCD